MPTPTMPTGLRSTTGRRRIIEIPPSTPNPCRSPRSSPSIPRSLSRRSTGTSRFLDRTGVVHTIHPTSHAGHARFELARADGGIPVHSICDTCGHVEPVVVSATDIAFTNDFSAPLDLGTITAITVTNTCNRNCPQGADQ
jgi:hypothetical protein